MKQILIVRADPNDADWITSETEIDDDNKDDFEVFKRVYQVVKAKGRSNWPSGDYCRTTVEEMYKDVLTEEEIEIFQGFLPYGEYGIHTVESARVLYVDKEEKL